MGMQTANVWHFGLLLTNTAFKPALAELHKKHPVCTKIRLFEIQNRKFFFRKFFKNLYEEESYPKRLPPDAFPRLKMSQKRFGGRGSSPGNALEYKFSDHMAESLVKVA